MFVCSVTAFAGQALAAAADGVAFFALTGVDYFVFSEATEGAEHGCILMQQENGNWLRVCQECLTLEHSVLDDIKTTICR